MHSVNTSLLSLGYSGARSTLAVGEGALLWFPGTRTSGDLQGRGRPWCGLWMAHNKGGSPPHLQCPSSVPPSMEKVQSSARPGRKPVSSFFCTAESGPVRSSIRPASRVSGCSAVLRCGTRAPPGACTWSLRAWPRTTWLWREDTQMEV
ncbi:hypothetical protein HJG60_007753 [Phyllostomus discolor]|uniref:Uncharacterized protein n=1 Tax=Phyllostomus discolor TaxID=89673 RepID=A0A834BMJ1_9CHIR|nr:hypothetical protein HJG60_007753 [Phyllostomus discolor]